MRKKMHRQVEETITKFARWMLSKEYISAYTDRKGWFKESGRNFLACMKQALDIYDGVIKYNIGGPGVSGDHIFTGDKLYMNFDADHTCTHLGMMYRVRPDKDSKFTNNLWISWIMLRDRPEEAIELIKNRIS